MQEDIDQTRTPALPTALCIFTGTLIAGEPPIHLGLFFDDFIYFVTSTKVEDKF